MDLVEIYELTAKAFETNHVKELLLGEGEWRVPVSRKAPANIPTDWDRIISYGISPYCIEKDFDTRKKQFEAAFCQLLNGNSTSVLIAYEHYTTYCYHVRSNEKNILFSDEMCIKLAGAIERNKSTFEAITEWCGYVYNNGLYEQIVYRDKTIARKFGMGVL